MSTTQSRQASGAFALNQGTQSFFQQRAPVFHTRKIFGLHKEVIIQINGRSHLRNLANTLALLGFE